MNARDDRLASCHHMRSAFTEPIHLTVRKVVIQDVEQHPLYQLNIDGAGGVNESGSPFPTYRDK